jgi:radical SAM protein with 4Fe4S-binding SPASM domain
MESNKNEILQTQQNFIEKLLLDPRVQRMAGFLSRPDGGNRTLFERLMYSYDNPAAPLGDRLLFYPLHTLFEHFIRTRDANADMVGFKLFHHRPTLRALVNTFRSISAYGLTVPQKFQVPLMIVWNFTQACNLKCAHCYQDACARPLPDELDLEQKLKVVDEMGREYIPFLALAGGEPFMGRHFWEVLRRCQEWGIHVTVASNGTVLTPEATARLVAHGVKYVEVSIDSTDPEKHDTFRGIPGAWRRAMDGIRTAAQTPGLRVGMATCISRMNFEETDRIVQLAIDSGCSTFVHFNYIPVGRGTQSDIQDLDPAQREQLLQTLERRLQRKEISIMSTAPQFGRACYMYADIDGRMSLGHAGSSSGSKTRVLAKYIGGCGSARCYCSIQPNGDVTPCVYIPHRVVGNVRHQSIREIWQNNIYFDKLADRDNLRDHCRVCDYRPVCGGCRARADAYTGDILAGDPGCILNSELWERLTKQHSEHVPVDH